ncbi:MAG: Crp/Fnr family transcriptional regulator [Bacteroidales bacterium]|nr:Crp/Fnr family transcriptional regulator [Bacteroidales bacterium]
MDNAFSEESHTHNSCTVSQYHINVFDHITDDEAKEIERNQVKVSFKKGEIIAKQGSFASHIIYVTSGLIKIYIESCNNEILILKIVPPGNLIGINSLFEKNNVFPFSAMAYQDASAKLIDINVFRKIVKQNAEFAFQIINVFSTNALQIYGRFYCFEKKQSYGRLADIILCLADNIYKSNEFELFLTRKELAELAGMSPESVVRMLKKFKDEGLIKEKGKTIIISEPEKLRQISILG